MSNFPDSIYVENLNKLGNSQDNIVVIENFLTKEDINTILFDAKNDIYPTSSDLQWSNMAADEKLMSKESKDILKTLKNKIFETASKKYNVELEILDEHILSPIIKWKSGSDMGDHIDDFAVFHYNISCILYINDDYEGGEIFFTDHGLTIKPKSGTLVMFPGNKYYPHKVLKVMSGDRYTSSTWLKFKNSSFHGTGRAMNFLDINDWKNFDFINYERSN